MMFSRLNFTKFPCFSWYVIFWNPYIDFEKKNIQNMTTKFQVKVTKFRTCFFFSLKSCVSNEMSQKYVRYFLRKIGFSNNNDSLKVWELTLSHQVQLQEYLKINLVYLKCIWPSFPAILFQTLILHIPKKLSLG